MMVRQISSADLTSSVRRPEVAPHGAGIARRIGLVTLVVGASAFGISLLAIACGASRHPVHGMGLFWVLLFFTSPIAIVVGLIVLAIGTRDVG